MGMVIIDPKSEGGIVKKSNVEVITWWIKAPWFSSTVHDIFGLQLQKVLDYAYKMNAKTCFAGEDASSLYHVITVAGADKEAMTSHK